MLKFSITTLLLLPSLLLLGGEFASAAETAIAEPQQHEQQQQQLNLGSILQHQEALMLECAKYHEQKVKKLEQLVKFNDDNGLIHFAPNLAIKIPAVCLFLYEQDYHHQEPAGLLNRLKPSKLETVNWLYSEDELRVPSENVTVKRETSAGLAEDQPEANELLQEFLYKPDARGVAQQQEPEDKIMLHNDLDKLLQNENFKHIISANRDRFSRDLSPVILVPGLLGSRLQARLDKAKSVNVFCSKRNLEWQDMWLSLRRLLPLAVDCWLDNVRLEFNPQTGFSKSPAGVMSKVPDFGSVESVRFLDLNQPTMTHYMAPLIERYEQLGYTPDKNLLAAPYDFRLAPQELRSYFKDLKRLTEDARTNNNGRQVTLVCHSMGCTHLLIFLRSQSAAWRQSNIRKLIALSSPWAGSMKALKALVVGDQLDLPLISEAKMRKLARTYPSIAYLLPQQEVFAKADHDDNSLVETPERSYKLNQLEELMHDLNLTQQWDWFQQSSALIKPLEPIQDLQVDCIHSLNTPTPETLIFKKQAEFPDGDYELRKGEGDGTVNFESLMVCAEWAKQLPNKVSHKIIMNTNHRGVLSHKTTLTHLTHDAYLH